MAYDIYDASIPPLIHMLGSLKAILAKGDAHGGIDPAEARLAPDMLPLKSQVYIATDGAKGCGARLAGVEIPKYEDTEVTFAELQARVAKTIDFLASLDRKAFAGAESKEIVLKSPTRTREFNGGDYVGKFVLPNAYFHITTAYDILRNAGVTLGKNDYLGGGQ
ncbi:MAG: hypothetical protein JWN16_923 [Alphaproteobacteria bacterium]|jgi:uncharacterized protein|nr:hypothetical protein [Alphaproteobacteria bacterium]